jgi:long-chain acyl-CoA synthetase
MSPDTALVPQPTLDDFPEFVSIPIRIARNAAAWPPKPAL